LAGFVNLIKKRFTKKKDSHYIEALIKRASAVNLFDKLKENNDQVAIQLKDLTMRFGGLVAVNELNMSIKKGTVHGLIGPNGSGKSTTVNLLTGIYPPAGGTVQLFGKSIIAESTYKRAKLGIARTFQNLQLFSDMTALQNVMVGMHNSFTSNLFSICFNLPKAQREEKDVETKAFAWLQFVGLEDIAFTEAKNLSYGQARLLEIARALASNPSLLLLDEPAAGLTAGEIEKINILIHKIKESGISVLLIEHHMDMVMAVSDEVTVLDFGKKIAEGTPNQIQNNPTVITAYLGTHETSFH
jgi:branched-chain amino acid transport system permease protein